MRNPISILILVLAFLAPSVLPAEELSTTKHAFDALLLPAFQSKCIQCHGKDGKVKGKVNLLDITSAEDFLADPELLQMVLDVIDFNEMPPEDDPQFKPAERTAVLAALEDLLDASAAPVTRAPIRRMNRFQYNNAVRDLFQLNRVVYSLPERMMREYNNYFDPASGKFPDTVSVGSRPLGKSQMIEPRLAGVAAFPQDLRAEHGYDNQGDHLSLSPMLLEAFMQLSQSVVSSKDFIPANVGIWHDLFGLPPSADAKKKAAAERPIPKKQKIATKNKKAALLARKKQEAEIQRAQKLQTERAVALTVKSMPQADLEALVRNRLTPFLRRAFRRPVDEPLLERYTSHALHRLDDGLPFADAMKEVASAAIASPRFLYLYDRAADNSDETEAGVEAGVEAGAKIETTTKADTETNGPQIDPFDLASRLSFFLWGSIPDDQLLDTAADASLCQPEVLDAQISRMLNDKKMKRFCDAFPTQWLQLDRIISSVPDRKHYPQFYFSKYRMSMHMTMEPLLLFECALVENRPILDFIDSDYAFRSGELSRFYNPTTKKQVGGNPVKLNFKRVKLDDRRHGGLLTTAATMTMTAGPEHSKPITRGAWLTTVVFNNPPEPPPANVPALSEEAPAGEEHLTLRERLVAHRERADCAGCHEKIDPLGFALENYGPTGIWRDHYENGRDVDMQGSLFRTHDFTTIVEFKDAILAEKERYARAFGGHLLAYALARPLSPGDTSSLDAITQAAIDHDYKLRDIIRGVIQSEAFLMVNNE